MALPLVESPAPPSEAQTLLREFADVFPLKLPPGLPVERVTDYRIVLLPDYKPFALWLYRMFLEEDKELNAQLDQHSADGYIEPARIARVADTSSARKNDGGLRHCLDCMALTGTTFQELTNYWMASKDPRSLVKWTFNKVFFIFGFFRTCEWHSISDEI